MEPAGTNNGISPEAMTWLDLLKGERGGRTVKLPLDDDDRRALEELAHHGLARRVYVNNETERWEPT